MKNGLNKSKILFYLIALVLLLFFPSTSVNHAKLLNNSESESFDLLKSRYEDSLDYTFKVSNKLLGKGEIKLIIEQGKIEGIANGTGKTSNCSVDFRTNIIGSLNKLDKVINVEVNGEGDPLVPFPGKVSYTGPLMGYFRDGKLNLVGKVTIKGRLAKYAGFDNTEDLVIEIPTSI